MYKTEYLSLMPYMTVILVVLVNIDKVLYWCKYLTSIHATVQQYHAFKKVTHD